MVYLRASGALEAMFHCPRGVAPDSETVHMDMFGAQSPDKFSAAVRRDSPNVQYQPPSTEYWVRRRRRQQDRKGQYLFRIFRYTQHWTIRNDAVILPVAREFSATDSRSN